MKDPVDLTPLDDPEGKLAAALVDEFLAQQGRTREDLAAFPAAQRDDMLRKAHAYASERLTEIGARAHYVHDLHHE